MHNGNERFKGRQMPNNRASGTRAARFSPDCWLLWHSRHAPSAAFNSRAFIPGQKHPTIAEHHCSADGDVPPTTDSLLNLCTNDCYGQTLLTID